MKFTIYPKDDIYLGITVDCSFYIMLDGEEVGYGGVSEGMKESEIYLEYVELYPSLSGRHHYRDVLCAIAEYFHANTFILESSINNRPIYEHFKAEEIDYDDVREMWSYRLPLSNLERE